MTSKLLLELDDIGYTLINKVTNITKDNLESLNTFLNHPRVLHNNNTGYNDNKRFQTHFHNVPTFVQLYEQKLLKLFPKYDKLISSVVKSNSGCKEQNAHVDYVVNDRFLSKLKICRNPPLNAVLGLERGAKLKVYPNSHKLMSGTFKAVRRSKRLQKKINPVYVNIPIGSVLIFRGDCIHAGCAYEKINKRILTFLIPNSEKYDNCLPICIDEVLTKNINFVKDIIVE